MDYAQESLKLHYEWKGKLDIAPKMAVAEAARKSGVARV